MRQDVVRTEERLASEVEYDSPSSYDEQNVDETKRRTYALPVSQRVVSIWQNM